MTKNSSQKTPVIICLMNSVSGVTSWGLTLKKAFKDHPKYELLLMNLWHAQKSKDFDFNPVDLEEAHAIFNQFSPAIIIPNYSWPILHEITGKNLAFIGMCHSDSDEEYYAPLHKHQGDLAKVISVSRVCTEALAQKLPHRVDDIVTLPCGIDVPKMLERSYKTKPIRLIYGGRIVQKQKRVFDLVSLVQQLQLKGVDFILNIVGEGADVVELEEKMSADTSSGNVHFLDRKSPADMADIWADHDIFIQVSDFEGTSVSMLEAMAQGTIPVVTAASSGVTEVIDDGKNGFISPVGDMQTMAEIIEKLASKPKSLSTIGKAAYENSKKYSIETYLTSFTKVVDSVADNLEWIRPGLKQFKYWEDKVDAANARIKVVQSQLEKLQFDQTVEEANYEHQLSENKAYIGQIESEKTDLEQLKAEIVELQKQLQTEMTQAKDLISSKEVDIKGLNQQILDQKAFIQQLEQQRSDTAQTLKQKVKTESHKVHTMFEQIKQKDVHIDWLEQERNRLNNSLSMRIGRIFYPIKSFFIRITGRSN